jgi:hypothetical protein
VTLTTERINLPTMPAPQAPVNFGQSGPARNNNTKLGVRRGGKLLSVFPPEVELARQLDKNFSVGVDASTGTHYLVIDPQIARGTKLNIYI